MAAGRLFLRLALIGTAVVLVVVLAVAGLTARLFLWPPSASPRQADAVVILSGDYGGRIIEARRLMGRHVAPVIVFAGTVDTDPLRDLCAGRLPHEVICVHPVPDITRHSAR